MPIIPMSNIPIIGQRKTKENEIKDLQQKLIFVHNLSKALERERNDLLLFLTLLIKKLPYERVILSKKELDIAAKLGQELNIYIDNRIKSLVIEIKKDRGGKD